MDAIDRLTVCRPMQCPRRIPHSICVKASRADVLGTDFQRRAKLNATVGSMSQYALFFLPRDFEQRHAGLETGCGDRPAEGTLLLVQQPMHHHAVQHHHDRIRDVRGPAFIDTGAHEMGGVSFDLDSSAHPLVTRSIQPRP